MPIRYYVTCQGESTCAQWVNHDYLPMHLNLLSGNVPYFIILLCLTPDNFTCQGESAATQWVKIETIRLFI
jgi:hypothetical protein